MPFFLKTKTIREVNDYFESLPLEELVKLNKRYGPHIIAIEERRDRAENTLKVQQEKLSLHKRKHELLLSQEDEVMEEEDKRRQEIAGLDHAGSRSEGYLLRAQFRNYSPLACYNSNLMAELDIIRTTTQLIQHTEDRIQSAKNDMSLTIQELKALNRIIEARREALKSEELAGIAEAGSSLSN